ncbi:MAG: hypothetical protein IJ417_00360 [Bacteroidaceae bacterium]|nr:hypothetical protein [Bacteroidaceae bacterium]
MSEAERVEFRQRLREGLNRSRYKLIREKALRNETLVEGDYHGGVREVSARDLLKRVYNEEITL